MRIFKRVLAVVLVCMMILPLGISSFAAWNLDEAVTVNWNPMAAKYSKGTWKIIAPKSENYEIRTNNFDFSKDENGGIKVVTPDYKAFAGTYGVSAVTSKATTPLDGLSVVITPDEFDSLVDSIDSGNSLNVLWTEEPITEIAGFNDASKSYDSGLYTAVPAYSNGLRHLIPVVEPADGSDKVTLTPAYKAPDKANGKALSVRVAFDKQIGDEGAAVASTVSIVYYDGYYINDDGHPGYRWTFSGMNHEDSKLGNYSSTSTPYEALDIRNGLAINVRADERLGFIVNINGYDYYKGEEIGFFPDCDTDWVGYKTNELKDEQIINGDPIWTTSMNCARADIDLTGLRDAGNGYVTVGAVSNNDQQLTEHHCNYTVKSINGVPAADWTGGATADHECSFELVNTIGATCTRDGRDYYRCTVCGKADNRNVVPAFGHTPKEDITVIAKPTCSTYGTSSRNCFVCKTRLETYHDAPSAHTFATDWTVIEAATCEKEGKRTNTCSVCSAAVEEVIPMHNFEWVVKTEATCLVPGSETQVCKDCGVEGETREIPSDTAHKFDASTPVIETIDGATDWFGKVAGTCTVCGEKAESTEDMYDIVDHFTDVKENHWFMSEVAFCVRQGYVSGMNDTTFAPNANLTRAQFLTLLAKFDGVDLAQYEGKDAGFEDVKTSHWWNNVINWAVENEYTSGISETKFGPSNNITRSQLARFFQVYTEKEGFDVSDAADLSIFPDAGKVQEWAVPSVKWAVAKGLIAGSNGKLEPNGNATRAQAARIFMMYANTEFKKVEPEVCEHVWGEWVVTIEPTTEAAGEKTATCTLCGETKTEEIPPIPCEHVWGEWTVTAPATHTADGKQTRTCTLCGEVETEDLLKHEADNTIRLFLDPADVEKGAKIDGTDATELLLPICYGEDYNDFIGDMPTASMEGYEFVGWYLEAYGFMMIQAEWDNGTYAVPGNCELYAIFEEIVVPCEHVWGDWTETAKATHTADGEQTRTCTLCGEVETEVIPAHEADFIMRFFIEDEWLEMGAKIDGTDATELLLPICTGEDYNDYLGDYPTATLEGYDFMGWYLESYGFLMTEGEWNGNYYALTSDCECYAIFEEAAPVLPLYNENGVDGYLNVGTADYDLSADFQYTLYEFAPTETGKYTITANDSLVGIASYNGMWVTIDPSEETVAGNSVEWDCTGVGQAIWVAVKGGAATANITVEAEAPVVPIGPEYVTYVNVALPESFTLTEDAAALVNVAYNDDVVDTAVLGEDGFYHLNTVDGPVLYVNLADTKMNLTDAMGFGQLKGSTKEDGVIKVITDYNEAYQAYVDVADQGYAPLTEDLMVILKEVGKNQGWYEGEGAWIATTEDAWMFACYYAEVAEPEYTFTLNFVADADAAITNDAALTYTMKLGDKYSDYITELPVAEKEGYVFKGWYNRDRRIALNPGFDAEKVFELYLGETGSEDDIADVESTLELIPIWDTEGEKDWTLTFVNWDNEDFETLEIGANVGDSYMSLFAGNYPDPGLQILDFGDGDTYAFVGWCIEHPDVGVFLLTEGDMWDQGYLALGGDWTFVALYEEI